MNVITHSQFAQLLAAKRGAVILSIVANTDARLLKTNNPHRDARKVTYTRVVSGADYEASVERQGGAGFKSEDLPYGKFLVKNKVIKTLDGKLQLRTVARNPQPPISVKYFDNGVEVPFQSIQRFLPPKKESKRQAAVGVVGKRQVMVRNYDFANILKVRVAGADYLLIPDCAQSAVTEKGVATVKVSKKWNKNDIDKGVEEIGSILTRLIQRQIARGAVGANQ